MNRRTIMWTLTVILGLPVLVIPWLVTLSVVPSNDNWWMLWFIHVIAAVFTGLGAAMTGMDHSD